MRLASLTRPDLIFPRLSAFDASTVLRALAEHLQERGVVDDAEALYAKLWEREQLSSTGIGCGVAVPHCKVKPLERAMAAVAICERGIEFAAVDAQPVRLFFLLISPEGSPAEHLQSLAAISRWVKQPENVERLLSQDDPKKIFALLSKDTG